jgi:TonB-linked SusC/RagA family outer membrane protein
MKANFTTTVLFLFIVFMAIASVTRAQSRKITGTVTSAGSGETLPGVNVSVKDTTTIGTSTDGNGKYSLEVPDNKNVLVFSYVGFLREEATIGTRSEINIALKQRVKQLGDLVVVGYGTEEEGDLTGSVSTVSGEDIENLPVNSFESALQGRTSGVRVNAGNAKLGQGIQVRIRGSASISADNQPLYIVDGMPVTSQSLSSVGGAGATNPMASLDMDNIESISVLKDASATAIYGSRASNGVVIITTKDGQAGETQFNASYRISTSSPSGKRDFMNARQYVDFFRRSAVGGGKYDYRINPNAWNSEQDAVNFYINNHYKSTLNSISEGNDWENNPTNYDWQDQAFQDAISQDFKLSVSGGDEKTTFYAGGGYSDQEGILIDNAYKKFSGRLNLGHKASEKIDLGLKIGLNRTLNDRLPNDNQFATPLQAVAQSPISPFFADADPQKSGYQKGDTYNTNTYYYNNMDITYGSSFRTRKLHTLGNANLDYNILPNLTFKTKFGLDIINQNEETYYEPRLSYYVGANGQGYNASTSVQNYIFDNTLRYENTFAQNHDLNAVVGTSYNWVMQSVTSVEGEDFPNEEFRNINNAANITSGSVTDTEYRFLSYFARANYKYNDRYLFTLSGRIDGSSRFGANNKYGLFPAASAGWILSDEEFLQNFESLSFLKFRASYGVTGNAKISNFPSLGLYNGISYAGNPALGPEQTPNPDLKWETTYQLNIGIDYGLFDGRINGGIDYYQKETNDLLLNVNVPGTSGFNSQLRNEGKLQNSGFELVLNSINTKGQFFWSSGFNISFNSNKITDLNGQIIDNGVNRAMEGEPIGIFYGYEYAGVNPKNGDALFYLNHEPTEDQLKSGDSFKINGRFGGRYVTDNSNAAKRTVIGNPNPNFHGGFSNKLTFKHFSLDVLLQFSYGGEIYNGGGGYMSASGYYFDNQTVDQLNAWEEPGDVTDVPEARLYWNNGASTESSRYISDGSYLRLKNVTLSYDLPKSFLTEVNMRKVNVYLTGSNLLTFTKYKGWDPEVNNDIGNSNLDLSTDFYAAPQPRTISVGVKLGF